MKNNILQNVLAAIMEGQGGKRYAGNIQKQAQEDLHLLNDVYKNPRLFLSEHAMTNRFDMDGWSPERIAESFERLITDENIRGIPNFTGRKGAHALWLEGSPNSLLSPVAPYKNGSIALTIIDPFTEKF